MDKRHAVSSLDVSLSSNLTNNLNTKNNSKLSSNSNTNLKNANYENNNCSTNSSINNFSTISYKNDECLDENDENLFVSKLSKLQFKKKHDIEEADNSDSSKNDANLQLNESFENFEDMDEEYAKIQQKMAFKPTIMTKTTLGSKLKQQEDPFLRDLTACIQAKQQQKKLNEANGIAKHEKQSEFGLSKLSSSPHSYRYSDNDNNPLSSYSSSINKGYTRFNLNLDNQINSQNESAICTTITAPSTTTTTITIPSLTTNETSIKFNKPSFNLAETQSSLFKPEVVQKRNLEPPPPAVTRSPSPNQAEKSGGLLAPSTYNVKIKTPVLSRHCILNITCDKGFTEAKNQASAKSEHNFDQTGEIAANANNRNIKPAQNGATFHAEARNTFTTLASSSFINASCILKLDENNKVSATNIPAVAVTKPENEHKFKPPSLLLSNLPSKPQAQKPNEQNGELKEEPVVKTKLNHLMSFNFTSPTQPIVTTAPLVLNKPRITTSTSTYNGGFTESCTNTKPSKVYASASTNTEHIITNSVSTNTNTDEIIQAGAKLISCKAYSPTTMTSSTKINKKNEETQTCLPLESTAAEKVESKTHTSISTSTCEDFDERKQQLVVSKATEKRKQNVKVEFDLNKFLKMVLYNEYNKNDLMFLKERLVAILCESPPATIHKGLSLYNNGLIKSLNHSMLNDFKFRTDKVNRDFFFSFILFLLTLAWIVTLTRQ